MTAKTSPDRWPEAWMNRSQGKLTPDNLSGDRRMLSRRRMLDQALFLIQYVHVASRQIAQCYRDPGMLC